MRPVAVLHFEADAGGACPVAFGGPTDVLVYFLSFAFSTRYGAQHELARLALLLRSRWKIDLAPLTTFADRELEVEADRRELERVWQDAAKLAETLRKTVEVLDSGDPQVGELTAATPDLRDRLDDLRRMAEWAAGQGARARLSFTL
jgi:hypothetical protein